MHAHPQRHENRDEQVRMAETEPSPQQRSTISALSRMIRPPIVGVVPLAACESGVPSRTTWLTDCRCSARRMIGPTMNDSSIAVTAAPTARNEM